MNTRELLQPYASEALDILDVREPVYGAAWKTASLGTSLAQIARKSTTIEVQHEKGLCNTDRFREDLKDLINWGLISLYKLDHTMEARSCD